MNKRVIRSTAKKKSVVNKNRRSQWRHAVINIALSSWLSHHQHSCIDAFRHFYQVPLQSILVCCVLGIALALPAALYSGLNNLTQVSQQWQSYTRLSAYLHQQSKPLAVEQLQARLLTMPEFDTVEVITPEQAKQEFIQHSTLGELLQSLPSNPLPTVILLQPVADIATYEQLQKLQKLLEQEILIDSVQIDLEWLQRLQAIMNLVQRVIVALALLLILGMVLNLANTIRLMIENRHKEIVVSKLVGATDAFIRRPFLYIGLCYGLGGGFSALLILQLLEMWMLPVVRQLMSLYEAEHSLSLLDVEFALFLSTLSVVLGIVAAWVAVLRSLGEIEPE